MGHYIMKNFQSVHFVYNSDHFENEFSSDYNMVSSNLNK